MKAKHTPEPWVATVNSQNGEHCIEQDGSVFQEPTEIALLQFSEEVDRERIVACVNACKGINPEAVPDLLAVVKSAANWFGELGNDDGAQGLLDDLNAAITKAEGTP